MRNNTHKYIRSSSRQGQGSGVRREMANRVAIITLTRNE